MEIDADGCKMLMGRVLGEIWLGFDVTDHGTACTSFRGRTDKAAKCVGVHETSVFNWEANTSQPDLRSMPGVIEFLGYNPLPEGEGIGGRLVRWRVSLGMSRREAAKRLGVDPSTLARWERGEREPEGVMSEHVERLLRDR